MKSRVRASVVLVQNQKLLTFFAVDPANHKEYHFLPGGEVEADETAPEAAERETLEETGYRIEVLAESAIDREYFFYWDGEDYDCLTIFYWGKLVSPMQAEVNDQPYNKGVVWIPLNEVKDKLSYSAEIRSAVEELINKHQNKGM